MEIRLEEVTKYYYDQGKSTKGLEGISLSFKTDSSFVVITGESGSGKSTLIKILTGIEDFDEGEIYFNDKPISGLKEEERHSLYARYISFVFQDYNLVESLSATDNIMLALLKHGYSIKEAKKKAASALKEVGLNAQRKMKTSRLSGGERQRVAIARSLALETPVIIFDEPTGNLDPVTSKEIVEIIHRVSKDKLIVYVTHDYELVKGIATRHIELSDGHVISDVPLKATDEGESIIEQKQAEMGFASYLYAAKSFAFSRVGRFLSTCLILLLSTFMLFSISATASFSFVSNNSSFWWAYPDEKSTLYSSLGNRVDVRKKDSEQPYPSLSDLKEGEDYYLDQGRLFDQSTFSLYETSALESCDKYQANGFDDYSTFDEHYGLLNKATTNVSAFAPSFGEVKNSFKAKGEAPDGYYSVKLYVHDGGSFSESRLGKALTNETSLSPLGKSACLTLKNSIFDKTSLSDAIDQKGKEFLLTSPKVWVNEVLVMDGLDYWSNDALIVGDKSFIEAARDFTKSAFKNALAQERMDFLSSSRSVLFDHYSCRQWPIYINYASYISLVSEDGRVYTNHFSNENTNLNPYNDHTIYLRNDFTSDPLKASLVWNNIRFSVEDLIKHDSSISVKFYDPTKVWKDENAYDAFVVSPFIITNYCLEYGGFDSFYFKSASLASSQAKVFSDGGVDAAYFEAHDPSKKNYTVIDFSDASISTKLISFSMLIGLLIALALVSLIVRLILTKFYYRKDFDQFVLNWIGYGKKDIFLVNLLQFIIIELFACIIIYPLMFILTPQYWTVFTLFPYVFILGFILNFVFAISLSVPKVARKKVRKND